MEGSKSKLEITGNIDQIIDKKVSVVSCVRVLLRTDDDGEFGDVDDDGCGAGVRTVGKLDGGGRFALLTLHRKVRTHDRKIA